LTVDPEGEKDFAKWLRLLRILWEPRANWDDLLHYTIGPSGLCIPLDRHGEPDFRKFAIVLGKTRLRSFGDADFILLALWTRPLRKELQNQVRDLLESRRRSLRVVQAARKIRGDMFDSLGISPR
jgi:hypothetical protein